VLVVHSGHCWEMLVAIKMFMVIMTFDGVLKGVPIAAVLGKNFFEKCIDGEYNLEFVIG